MSDSMFKKLLIGIGGVVLVCVVVIAVYAATAGKSNSSSDSKSAVIEDPRKAVDVSKLTVLKPDTVWSQAAFMGSETAEHKLVVYSDLFCPYCRKAFEAIVQNMDDFKPLLDSGKLSYELRITDGLSNASDPDENYDSTTGGEIVQCAALQNKFWDFMTEIENKIYDDYYSKGLGDRHYDRATETDWKKHMVPKLETSYFTDVLKGIDGVDSAKVDDCVKTKEGLKQLEQYTKSATAVKVNSFPAFFFDGVQDKSFYNIDNTYDYAKFYKGIKTALMAKGIS